MKSRFRPVLIGLGLAGIGVAITLGFFMLWLALHPEGYDPKNIYYVLWKHNLNRNVDLDKAVSAMTHDTWAVRLVEGKSKEELTDRFGFIRAWKNARPYDQLCSSNGSFGENGIPAANKEVVFLRDSDWMVILDGGKAVDLALCKGY